MLRMQTPADRPSPMICRDLDVLNALIILTINIIKDEKPAEPWQASSEDGLIQFEISLSGFAWTARTGPGSGQRGPTRQAGNSCLREHHDGHRGLIAGRTSEGRKIAEGRSARDD